MDAQEYINKYGGKLGGWFFLRDIGGFERYLLPLYYVLPDMDGYSLEKILPKNIVDNWILRASHPNDHEGLVDILESPTVIGFNEPRNVVLDLFKTKIQWMRDESNKPEIFAFSEYEGQKYDGKIRIGIQPLNHGQRGSIVEYPHERDTYLIDLVTKQTGHQITDMDRIVLVGNNIDEENSFILSYPFRIGHETEELAKKIVELYKKVRETSFINQDYSFQMEFGVNKAEFEDKDRILFFQARPFLKFAEPPFEIKKDKKEYGCFGITKEEGVVLPVVKTLYGEGVNNIPEYFAWTPRIMTRMDPKVMPKNIGSFIPDGIRAYSLEHNAYRWVRKAQVSILDQFADIEEYKTGDRIRVISNGLNYKLDKVT